MNSQQAWRVGALLASTVLLLGCPKRSALWIEPGSTARHLIFGVGKTRHGPPLSSLQGITVVACGRESELPNSALWSLGKSSDGPVPTRIVYGVDPPGYTSHGAAPPLITGCYRAEDSGSGRVEFVVHPEGTVTERGA